MKINDGKVVTSLYDKRDGFNFKILKFPDLKGKRTKPPFSQPCFRRID